MKNLTKREEEVMKLVSEGLTNKEIANALFISPHTVKAILENLFQKFNLHSRLLLAIEFQPDKNKKYKMCRAKARPIL